MIGDAGSTGATPAGPAFRFRTEEGAEFEIEVIGADSLDDVATVRWRGVELCVACFLEALTLEESTSLLRQLIGDVREM